ncbi:MAG: DUF3179 domain-containing (seleno)protein [Actinomycetota bacterium]|nr:DUF3179 domain-containing (seleno)protein [Actinomycetota bacterium]
MKRLGAFILTLLTACTTAAVDTTTPEPATTLAPATTNPVSPVPTIAEPAAPTSYPPAPSVPVGPLNATTAEGLDALLDDVFTEEFDSSHLSQIVEGGDARAAWVIADLLRFYQTGPDRDELVFAFTQLTGAEFVPGELDFVWTFNHLLAWDLPAWDGHADVKQLIFGFLSESWAPFFEDDEKMDWRPVTWGGVLIDERAFGSNGPCNCIPALDNPPTTDAAGGDWYPDDRVVFGIVVNDQALALPRHQMEVHEMVNLTLGGRELGIPYCTLCGSAQAYFTDDVPGVDRVVLRTSGLLTRSNKVTYDLTTRSVIDTFTGEAKTGPLAVQGVTLEQVSVVASTWGDWKAAHPDTHILARDGGIGRVYDLDPLGDRDAQGPIFPVGDVDPRLPTQEPVVGVIGPDGTPIAFPTAATREALAATGSFEFEGVTVELTDGIRIFGPDGSELTTHQSFWFAWSQFHPGTLLWSTETG